MNGINGNNRHHDSIFSKWSTTTKLIRNGSHLNDGVGYN